MNDPHVEKLHYKLIHDKSTDYKIEASLRVEENEFTISLDPQGATIDMKTQCATEHEARALVDPYVDCWTAHAVLQEGPGQFGLEFKNSEIVDRQPIPGEIHVPTKHFKMTGYPPSIHMLRGNFPNPPKDFFLSPDVKSMIQRYSEFRMDREKLTSMAYFCLTVIEISAGNQQVGEKELRKKASTKYGVDIDILSTLGKLSAKGSETEARKAQKSGYAPLTKPQRVWINQVIMAIILRLGKYAFDPSGEFRRMTMADFPKL